MSHLNSPRRRRPDEFVHLQLESRFEFVGQHPLDDLTRFDPAENGGEKDGVTFFG